MYFFVIYIFVLYVFFCVVLCDVYFVTFPVVFVCICVLNNCHRVATQLQLNISYHRGLVWFNETQVFLNVTSSLLINDYRRFGGGGYALYDFLNKIGIASYSSRLFQLPLTAV
jgi:hypothetical protein